MATVEVLSVFEEKNMQLQKLNIGRDELVSRPVHSASASSPCELYFGGACRGNSGAAGIGFLLIDSNGEVIERFSSFLGYQFTNNAAEFKALIAGLQHALGHGIRDIKAYGDSDLVCSLVNGECMIKKEWLRRYCDEAWYLLNKFASREVVHVRREENEAADGLANQGIDQLSIDTSPAAQDKVINNCMTPRRATFYVLGKRCEGVVQLSFILETIKSALPISYAAVEELCSEMENRHNSFPGSDDGSELNDVCMSCLLAQF
eukprot:PITA_24572